jgi:hypothetical protein
MPSAGQRWLFSVIQSKAVVSQVHSMFRNGATGGAWESIFSSGPVIVGVSQRFCCVGSVSEGLGGRIVRVFASGS